MKSIERDAPEAQKQMVHGQTASDFLDPSLEWRRVFAEIWGTFLLVLVAAGGGVVAAMSNGRVTLAFFLIYSVVVTGITCLLVQYLCLLLGIKLSREN